MLLPLLIATLVVLGATLTWRGLFPSAVPLESALADLQSPRAQPRSSEHLEAVADGFRQTIGAGVARSTAQWGLDLGALHADLRVIGVSVEAHMFDRLVAAVAFFVLPAGVAALATIGGVSFPSGLVVVASVALGPVGFLIPILVVRSEARRRRRELRHGLAAYLDLVVIMVAGGAGIESALGDAARVGEGPAFAEIGNALAACQFSGEAPWAALERLGAAVGIEEVRELAASVGLAATRGARIRDALAAKAVSLRDHQLAEAETEAQEASEKMAVPVVLMLFGFVAFVMFPALQLVIGGL